MKNIYRVIVFSILSLQYQPLIGQVSDSTAIPLESGGHLKFFLEDNTLIWRYVSANGSDSITGPLLKMGDTLELNGLKLDSIVSDAELAGILLTAIRDHQVDIMDWFNLLEVGEGRLYFGNPGNANDSPAAPASPAPGNARDTASFKLLDRFTYVITDAPIDVSVLVTNYNPRFYKIVFERVNSAGTIDTTIFRPGRLFYVPQFDSWLNLTYNGINATIKTNLINRISEIVATSEVAETMRKRNEVIGSIVDSIEAEEERPRIAGQLMFNGPAVLPLFRNARNNNSGYVQVPGKYFRIDNIRVFTDYNRISDLRFTGYVVDRVKKDSVRVTFNNRRFSIGFPTLTHRNQRFYAEVLKQNIWINPKSVITYEPVGGAYSTTVKNSEISMNKDNRTAILYRKSFSDYIALQVFLDPLGFFNDRPNGFTQIEGSAYIPMNFTNAGNTHWGMKNTTSFSYVFTNAVNSEPRFARFDSSLIHRAPFGSDTINTLLINNLDLVRNYFYQLTNKTTILSVELKRWNAWLHLGTGFRLWGSRVGPNRDSLVTYHRLFWEFANVSLEIRPDRPFGLNIDLGIGTLNSLRRNNNNPKFPYDPQFLFGKTFVLTQELNFYHYLSDRSKGGLFFRYAGFLAYNKNPRADVSLNPTLNGFNRLGDYFPLILIGYSTNISALVKGEVLKNGEATQSAIKAAASKQLQ